MNRILYIFILLVTINLYAQATVSIKNLYIFIEPTVEPNYVNRKGKEENDILYNSKRITLNIVRWAIKERVKRIIINDKELKKNKNPAILMHFLIKNNLLKKRRYKIGKLLGDLHNSFLSYDLKSKDTLFVYIGDVNFVRETVNSHGAYLTSGWLKNQDSPFVRKFLKADNSSLKDTPTVIINRTQLNLKNEKKRENFLVKLFSEAGMKVYYIGNSNMAFGGRIDINYITDELKLIANKKINNLKNINVDDNELCQIVWDPIDINTSTDINMNIPDCGRY